VSGRLFHRRAEQKANPAAYDPDLQEALLDACAALTGTASEEYRSLAAALEKPPGTGLVY